MSNIHTLGKDADEHSSRGRSNSSDESGDSDDDSRRQGFFVGGSDRSGQEVLGPSRRDNNNAPSSADQFFEAIRRAGAERLTQEQNDAQAQAAGQQSSGMGTGGSATEFRLGGHGVQSERIGGTETGSSNSSTTHQHKVRLVFWSNGFTVDDGPLRSFQDPNNKEFLQAVMTKRIPAELLARAPGRQIDLRIEKKSTDYELPKVKPFTGQGNRLGEITPSVVGGSADVVFVDGPPKLSDEEAAKLLAQAQAELAVDDSAPTTRVQIRIPDAARPIVARLNQTHTVNQLRMFIVTADPSLAYRPFRLMTSYPMQPIDDEELCVKEAGLLNATVLLKFE